MSTRPIDSSPTPILVEPARTRQTQPPAAPFRAVLAGGVNVLMSGAEAATSVVGGPLLAAAVRDIRSDAVNGIAGRPAEASSGGAGGAPGLTDVAAMQRESQAFNLNLLALQEEIQQENRRFSTVSNVLRARHDTAKAAISNIRS